MHYRLLKFSEQIEKNGGLGEFKLIDLMEWFMKSVMDIMLEMDYTMKSDSNQEWPTNQIRKKLFADMVDPIEQLVVHLLPLPPYKFMR